MKNSPDLICLSHLRWGFVYQRPQHLLSRFARHQRVFFFEEPMYSDAQARLDVRREEESGVHIVVPWLPHGLSTEEADRIQTGLLKQLLAEQAITDYVLWYYTPMALAFTRELTPRLVVYDCMDELSAFQGAPPILKERERALFQRANLVFTGGQTLYEAKRSHHPDIHAFPSSVDVQHFAQARAVQEEPEDQRSIPHPRIGYCGVIDERMDLDLLAGMAELRPDWHFIMIGPVVKIEPGVLPRHSNIHYLGSKDYKQLPRYLSGWDAAMLPFARNESTRFISPTKTPEYLAAGVPSVSTSIRDVVRPYGEAALVGIADDPVDFVAELHSALTLERPQWQRRVDSFLQTNSWDATWKRMWELMMSRMEAAQEDVETLASGGKVAVNV